MVKFAIFILLLVASINFAEESSNPPIAHDADASRKEEADKSQQNKQNAPTISQPTSPPALTIRPVPNIASEQRPPNESTREGSNVSQQPKEDRMWPPSAGWAAVYVAGVSALATVIYALISLGQWRAIRRQADIATEGVETNRIVADATRKSADTADFALKSLERAYLSVRQWQMVNFKEGSRAQAICSFANVGRTPGWITAIYCAPYLSEQEPNILDYKQVTRTYAGKRIIIHPQEERHLPIDAPSLGASDHTAVQNGAKRLYFYACVVYEDIFKRE
jgi:hypothetical protein